MPMILNLMPGQFLHCFMKLWNLKFVIFCKVLLYAYFLSPGLNRNIKRMLIKLLSIFQSWLLHINTNILLVLTKVPWKCSAPLHIIAWRLRSALTSQSWNRVLCFSVRTLSEQSLSAEHLWKETPLGKPFHKYLTTLNSIFDVKTSQGAAFGSRAVRTFVV